MSKPPPTGKLARGAVGGLALAQAGVARMGHQVRKLVPNQDSEQRAAAQLRYEEDLGRIVFCALNQLKGTALKLSQVLASHADFLPEPVRKQLARGCYQVTPLNRALVHKVFRQEFACGPDAMFASFDAQAFAAASLGQVHRATLADGSRVAVKIQYPGIAASIGSDVRMVRTMLQTLGLGTGLLPRKELVDQVMDEIEHKLQEELDYEHEAAQLTWFHANAALAGIVIPRPLPEQSTRRILTMEHLDGLHLDQWLATNPDQASRNQAGQRLFDWFWHSLFVLRRLHADPHPGNFLFMPDGRVGLLDFGCTKTISPQFCDNVAAAWNACLRPDAGAATAALRASYIGLDLISPSLTQREFDEQLMPVVAPMIDWQLAPFRGARFDFGASAPFPQPDLAQTAAIKHLVVGMHEDVPYFDRAYLGVHQMLKQLGAVVVTANRWIGAA